MSDPYGRTPQGFLDRLKQRLDAVERRQVRMPQPPDPVVGTTAERDALYGDPATLTTAEKAALANRRPVWFNTDTGRQESYYVPTGTAGLTAPGLVATAAAGWYPVGRADSHWVCKTNAFQSVGGAGTNTNINGWTTRYNEGGITLGSDRLVVPRAGRYEINAMIYITGGSISVTVGFNLSGTGPATPTATGTYPRSLIVTARDADEAHHFQGITPLASGAALAMATLVHAVYSGAGNAWGPSDNWGWGTNMRLTYVGPPLA